MKRLTLGFLLLTLVSATTVKAEDSFNYYFESMNLSGVEDLPCISLVCTPTRSNAFVEVGKCSFDGLGTGQYVHYPMLNYTVFSGAANGAQFGEPGAALSYGGSISNGVLSGYAVLVGFDEYSGVHKLMDCEPCDD